MDLGQNWLLKDVNKSGAVSPATRAIDNKTPVKIPFLAVLITMLRIVFHSGIPKAQEASRSEWGISLTNSSVVRVTIGIIINPKAQPPARAEKFPMGLTITV